MLKLIVKICALVAVAALCACTPAMEIQKNSELTPIVHSGSMTTKPVQLKRAVIKCKRGEQIATLQSGLACLGHDKVVFTRSGKLDFSDGDLTEAFRDILTMQGYEVVGDSDALFDDPAEWKAEILVAALVKDIKCNICFPWSDFGNFTSAKGEGYMEVEWQIYSRLDRKVVYKTTTTGYHERSDREDDKGFGIWIEAFAAAANNLLADKKFVELVTTPRGSLLKPDNYSEKISIRPASSIINDLHKDILQVQDSVVTIYAGNGHGSGFFISDDGYILTNEHVVKNSKNVTIKLSTNRKILGEVVRVSSSRDVALIKTGEVGHHCLPVTQQEPQIGSDVYAIGSPLSDEMSGTFSKGIVSGYRNLDGAKFIQSDVNIQPGNSGGPITDSAGSVVGISTRGLFRGEASTGLNFFVPIGEAMSALNIDFNSNTLSEAH